MLWSSLNCRCFQTDKEGNVCLAMFFALHDDAWFTFTTFSLSQLQYDEIFYLISNYKTILTWSCARYEYKNDWKILLERYQKMLFDYM